MARNLLILGLIVMVLAVIDPMEGSVVILAGAVLAAFAAARLRSPYRVSAYTGAILIAVGVAAMWGLSAVGGFGGTTGRTNLWWLALLPYPVGWVVAIAAAARGVRDGSGARGGAAL